MNLFRAVLSFSYFLCKFNPLFSQFKIVTSTVNMSAPDPFREMSSDDLLFLETLPSIHPPPTSQKSLNAPEMELFTDSHDIEDKELLQFLLEGNLPTLTTDFVSSSLQTCPDLSQTSFLFPSPPCKRNMDENFSSYGSTLDFPQKKPRLNVPSPLVELEFEPVLPSLFPYGEINMDPPAIEFFEFESSPDGSPLIIQPPFPFCDDQDVSQTQDIAKTLHGQLLQNMFVERCSKRLKTTKGKWSYTQESHKINSNLFSQLTTRTN